MRSISTATLDLSTRITRSSIVVFLACLGLHLAWTLATPVTSAPDEPAHIYRAVSLWEGDLVPSARAADGQWLVDVPSSVVRYAESTACARFAPDVPASCARPALAPGSVSTVETGAGRYSPVYYAAVGWPGRIAPTVAGFYAMRLVSLLVSSALLALAVTTVLRHVGRGWASLVLPLAITPQVLWLGSVVNPNAWEVDAGLLTWAAGLALITRGSRESRRALWIKLVLGASVLALMRALGPLWLGLIAAGILAVRYCLAPERRRKVRLPPSRRAAVALGVVGALVAASLWWHLTFERAAVDGLANPQPAPGGFAATLKALIPDLPQWVDQTYGRFGWLDTFSPSWVVLTWVALGAATFALVVLGSDHRVRVVVTVAVAVTLCLAVPLAFEMTVGREVGIHFWQARYTMPFGQGIPLALAVIGANWVRAPADLRELLRWSPAVAWLMWPVLGTVTFVSALHRFAAGQNGGWSFGDLAWRPVGGPALVVALEVIAGVALVLALRTPARSPENGHDLLLEPPPSSRSVSRATAGAP